MREYNENQLTLAPFQYTLEINGKPAYEIRQSFEGGCYFLIQNGCRNKAYSGDTPYCVFEYFAIDHPEFEVNLIDY